MADERKCPPHDYRTTATTTDRNGNIISATQVCNDCGDTQYLRA